MPGYNPSFTYGFAVNGVLFVMQFMIILLFQGVSKKTQVEGGFTAVSTCMIIIPFVAGCLSTPTERYWWTFLVLIIFGIANTFAQGNVYGLAAILPGKYIGIVSFGNGISGIVVNVLKAILNVVLGGVDNQFF